MSIHLTVNIGRNQNTSSYPVSRSWFFRYYSTRSNQVFLENWLVVEQVKCKFGTYQTDNKETLQNRMRNGKNIRASLKCSVVKFGTIGVNNDVNGWFYRILNKKIQDFHTVLNYCSTGYLWISKRKMYLHNDEIWQMSLWPRNHVWHQQ